MSIASRQLIRVPEAVRVDSIGQYLKPPAIVQPPEPASVDLHYSV